MDAHATHAPDEHTHPSAGVYAKVGLVLFVLTALEVGLYEITYGEHAGAFGRRHPAVLRPDAPPHVRGEVRARGDVLHASEAGHRLFTGVFVFPLIIATVIIVALIVLMAYHFAFARSGG